MRCSFRTHPFSRMRFPGLAPWAGMRCPVGANRTTAFRSRVLAPKETYALHPTHVGHPLFRPPIRRMWDTHLFNRQKWVSQIHTGHPGLVCVAPLGQIERRRFNRVSSPQKRHTRCTQRMWDTHSFDHQSRQKWVSQIHTREAGLACAPHPAGWVSDVFSLLWRTRPRDRGVGL